MKKLFKEFKDFINKGNAVALAIVVIIGGAFTAIVTSVNKQVISPLIGALLGDADLSQSLITVLSQHTEVVDGVETVVIDNAIYWGALLQTVIDFLLTAVILFTIFKVVTAISNAAKKAHEKALEALRKEEPVVEVAPEPEPEPVPAEPTIEEKQLALLESINEQLAKLNSK
jgi:large conductance mechanosensitive channel